MCSKTPYLWFLIKLFYITFHVLFSSILSSSIYNVYRNKHPLNKKPNSFVNDTIPDLNLYVGNSFETDTKVFIPEKGLFQNILVTGTIGTGKTSSAMYPFVKQLISYKSVFESQKIGMLILDVKGNFHKEVYSFCKQFNRLSDLIVIDLTSNIKYNPLHKPNLKPLVLANRLKTILTLFSPNTSDSYWLDKVEQVLAECIKFCRLYNDNYVTFIELHNLINIPNYYKEKIEFLRKLFQSRITFHFSNLRFKNIIRIF